MVILEPHQIKAVKESIPIFTKHNFLYLAGQPRIGKTFISLSIVNDMKFKKVLFLTKKKAIKSIEEDIRLLNPTYESLVINYESAHKIEDPNSFDVVILDEAHNLGAFPKPTRRHKIVKQLFYNKPQIGLSGTPSPESFSQLFHQFTVCKYSPWSHYRNFYRWADKYVIKKQKYIGSMVINDYSEARKDLINEEIKPYFISISQRQANFKSLVEEQTHSVKMTDLQRLYFDSMKKHFVIDTPAMQVTATNGADRINKLAQICGGSMIDDEKETHIFRDNNKIQYIKDNFRNKKIAIFYRYKAERELLALNFYTTESPEEFNERDDLIFIGQFQSIREGVNLKTADAIIMYAIDFSATSYEQSKARLQHKDRTKPSVIHWLFSIGGIEQQIYRAVKNKKNFTSNYYKKCLKEESIQRSMFSIK